MKKKMLSLMPVVFAMVLFTQVAHAKTQNGITCNLFISVQNGANNWPVNGKLFYCGDTPTADAAGVSEVWNAGQGATEDTAGDQTIPYLRKEFTATNVELYVFDTEEDFNRYFGVDFPQCSGDDDTGCTVPSGGIPDHSGPLSAIYQYAPAIKNNPQRLLLVVQSTNHELGHQLDILYKFPSGHDGVPASENYRQAVEQDMNYIDTLTCLDVFGGLSGTGVNVSKVCAWNIPNSESMVRLWKDQVSDPAEFFANVFAASSEGGAAIPALGAVIHNFFTHSIAYEYGLRTGTGQR